MSVEAERSERFWDKCSEQFATPALLILGELQPVFLRGSSRGGVKKAANEPNKDAVEMSWSSSTPGSKGSGTSHSRKVGEVGNQKCPRGASSLQRGGKEKIIYRVKPRRRRLGRGSLKSGERRKAGESVDRNDIQLLSAKVVGRSYKGLL